MNKRRIRRLWAGMLVGMMAGVLARAQAPEQSAPPAPTQDAAQSAPGTAPTQAPVVYQPKFPGDPARSESEAQALGYMRVVLRAQKEYKKRHDKYAETLPALAGTGSLTKRMARSTERGDYTAGFRSQKDGFILTMTPKQMDSEHRSFYAEEDGVIHADDQKAADLSSPKIK
ncbi:MAG: hypothetical protein HY233_00785 [Acidobacteriales bacterium]|nr:hypothetical protein [Candidatus Koribacter versatilis]MBI3644494.1 hypothetical protein [Terriglobales bacterium]